MTDRNTSTGRTSVAWGAVAAVGALALLTWGLSWVGDIRFTGPKRETAAKLVMVGGAAGLVVAEAVRRWKPRLGHIAYGVVVAGIPLALWVVVDTPLGDIRDAERRPTAAESELPLPAPLRPRTADDVESVAVGVTLEEFTSGLETPVDAAFLLDRTMLVAEREGRVRSVSGDGVVDASPVIDISQETTIEGERGLLGITVSPSERLYAHFTNLEGDNSVVSWQLVDGRAGLDTRLEVMSVGQTLDNHNGGGIEFGPEGMLYVAIGDGGGVGDPLDNAQASWNRLGTVLRVLPDEENGGYTVPPDNPFVDHEDVWPEIVAYGLRNPLRVRFDAVTGDLWIGDVGDTNFEEVNLIPAGEFGQNFGWNRMEGDQIFSGYDEVPTNFAESDIHSDHSLPLFVYAHDKSETPDQPRGLHPWRNSITGGVRYRGSEIAGLYGVYLYADFAASTLGGVAFDEDFEPVDSTIFDIEIPVPVSMIEDESGEIFVVSLGGSIYRLRAR